MNSQTKERKKYFMYLGLLFLATLLTYKLPHNSVSFLEYFIKPIRLGSITIHFSSFIPIGLILFSIIGITNLKQSRIRSKFLMIIILFMVILPFMKWSLDSTRSLFYKSQKQTITSLDIEKADISINGTNNKITVTMAFSVIDYGRGNQRFQFRVNLPPSLSEFTKVSTYESDTMYWSNANRDPLYIVETFDIIFDVDPTMDQFSRIHTYDEATIYELYNEKESVQIIDQGLELN